MPKKRFRVESRFATEDDVRIDPKGGKRSAGIIKGLSLCARGEALGHGLHLDSQFIEDLAEAAESAANGIKCRFRHPGMCSDGLGSYLGRIYYTGHTDNAVYGDLHFSKSAHDTPDGDLANYVMQLAEDPDMAGLSIVFERDFDLEEEFLQQNTDEDGNFQSPDESNESQYRHARLALLKACDVVDSPAANPSGLFHDPIHNEALAIANYVVGVTEEVPYLSKFEIGPDKVKGFIDSYLSRHNLKIVSLDEDNDMTIQAFKNKKDALTDAQAKRRASAQEHLKESLEEDKSEAPVDETQEDEVKDEQEESAEDSNEDEAPVDETEDVDAETEEEKDETPEEVSASAFKAQLKKFTEAFGEKNGLAWFQDGISFDEGCSRQLSAQRDEIAKLQKQIKTLKSGAAPVSFSEKGKSEDKPIEKKSLRDAGIVRIAGK